MTLPLCAKHTLPLCYEMLRSTMPFKQWGLPPSTEVEFRVTRERHVLGTHTRYVRTDEHIISISNVRVGHMSTLIETMAHEMVHVKTRKPEHNKEFYRLWRQVCRYHGFDPKEC